MNQTLARILIQLANAHDGGVPQPRARLDEEGQAVIVKSTEVDLQTGEVRVVETKVQTLKELRNELGY